MMQAAGRRRLRRARCARTRPRPSTSRPRGSRTPDEIERTQLDAAAGARRIGGARVPFFARAVGGGRLRPRRRSTRSTTCGVRRRTPSTTSGASIDANPPWGDYQGVLPADALREPMRVYMSGGTTGKSRPTFYTQWDREVGVAADARGRSTCRASAPATSCSTRGPTARTTARWCSTRRCTAGSTAWCSPRAPATSRAANGRCSSRSSTRRPRSSPPATTCCASPTSRARWATTPKTDFNIRALPEHRRPRAARGDLRRRVLQLVRLPRGAVGVGGVPRSTTGCTSSKTRSSCRSSIRRSGEPLPDGELGSHLHHRALQDRQPAVPLQHHGPLVPVPARAVRVRELAAQDGAVRRAAATTW